LHTPPPPTSPPFPYTTLFRSPKTVNYQDLPVSTLRGGQCVTHWNCHSRVPRFRVRRSRLWAACRPQPITKADSWTAAPEVRWPPDRKSTRLNSSHVSISYAVF